MFRYNTTYELKFAAFNSVLQCLAKEIEKCAENAFLSDDEAMEIFYLDAKQAHEELRDQIIAMFQATNQA